MVPHWGAWREGGEQIDKKNNIYIKMQFWFFDKYDNSEEDATKNRRVEKESTVDWSYSIPSESRSNERS